MHQVLIAVRVIGWSTIVLSMGSCANSQLTLNAQNSTATENPALLPIVDKDPVLKQSQPDPLVSSSTVQSPPPIAPEVAKIATTKSPNLVSVPYVNPLNSIPLLAQHQIANSCQAFPCLILSQSPNHPHNRFNNPIYKLTAYRDNTSNRVFQLDAVTGRGFTQARNRYQSLTEAPLPDGSYAVASRVVVGSIREVGGTMVPIFPKQGFNPKMRRTALGIHWDPSFDKDKKEDGTSGCIGLTKKGDYHRVRDFIIKYHPRSLEVQIDR
ncbi:hypothetical protein [Chamaesiphon sp. VAR_48_metabat_135_sub]|uniref:hypothetical protein n=1 Tax=Chamaesiphon sp. VAR_48_metabat_135_sub TaxID=2964699 RepID=UPI00286B00D7|nr:hypothetical protein [Chamaesiphon sp. VAR_48_metabat_135_sub]